MKSVFTAKYLQHLNSKKNKDGGFTLIELLVVIIIVGVLAAIALPSFLNQIGKARGSEAKSNLGTINRAQQAYRLENGSMANALPLLDAKINTTDGFFDYAIPTGTFSTNNALTTAKAKTLNDLKAYNAYVSQNPTTDAFSQVICESNAIVASSAAAPTNLVSAGACDTSNSKSIK